MSADPDAGASPAAHAFEGVIEEGRGGGAFVPVPFDVESELGGRRPKVRATFDGVPYRGSIAFMGGRPLLGVTRAVRDAAGKDVGDRIRVTVEADTEPRVVAVPEDLAEALARAGQRERFDGLAYTHRREFVEWVSGAKRAETRERRIERAVGMVAAGETRS